MDGWMDLLAWNCQHSVIKEEKGRERDKVSRQDDGERAVWCVNYS